MNPTNRTTIFGILLIMSSLFVSAQTYQRDGDTLVIRMNAGIDDSIPFLKEALNADLGKNGPAGTVFCFGCSNFIQDIPSPENVKVLVLGNSPSYSTYRELQFELEPFENLKEIVLGFPASRWMHQGCFFSENDMRGLMKKRPDILFTVAGNSFLSEVNGASPFSDCKNWKWLPTIEKESWPGENTIRLHPRIKIGEQYFYEGGKCLVIDGDVGAGNWDRSYNHGSWTTIVSDTAQAAAIKKLVIVNTADLLSHMPFELMTSLDTIYFLGNDNDRLEELPERFFRIPNLKHVQFGYDGAIHGFGHISFSVTTHVMSQLFDKMENVTLSTGGDVKRHSGKKTWGPGTTIGIEERRSNQD